MSLKWIKTRPDGPGQMSLTDIYLWAEQKASSSPASKTLRENKEPMKIEPKHWEIPEGRHLNEGFLYGGMTCPPRLGFLK